MMLYVIMKIRSAKQPDRPVSDKCSHFIAINTIAVSCVMLDSGMNASFAECLQIFIAWLPDKSLKIRLQCAPAAHVQRGAMERTAKAVEVAEIAENGLET